MALKLKKPLGAATMTKAMVDGKAKTTIAEETHQEPVEAPEPANDDQGTHMGIGVQALDPFCEILVEASFTKNLGNYQSAKIGVSLKMPCQQVDLDDAFTFTRDWVNTKLEGMVTELGE